MVLEIQESIKYSKWEREEWVSVNKDIEESEKELSTITNIYEREDLIDTIRLLNDHKDEEEFELIRDNHALKKKYNTVWDKIDRMNEMKKIAL